MKGDGLVATAQKLHDQEPDTQLILIDDDSEMADYIKYAKAISGQGEIDKPMPVEWADKHIIANVQKYMSGKFILCGVMDPKRSPSEIAVRSRSENLKHIMTYVRSTFRHPALPKNDLGYTVDYYEGSLSTLCAGCGHDSINAAIVEACWEMNIEPHKVAKLSGSAALQNRRLTFCRIRTGLIRCTGECLRLRQVRIWQTAT